MTLKIVQVGEPILRQRSRPLPLDEIRSPRIQQLISDMRDTMRDAPGVGLAAPQVGEGLRLFVVEDRQEYLQKAGVEQVELLERTPVSFRVFINPELTIVSGAKAEFFEGCLSFAGFVGLVPRALEVHVDALDERGEPFSVNARGWYARILQHETDHLNGVVCVDRMALRTLTTVENLAAHWADRSVDEVCRVLEADKRLE